MVPYVGDHGADELLVIVRNDVQQRIYGAVVQIQATATAPSLGQAFSCGTLARGRVC